MLPANTLNSGAPYIFFPSQFGDIINYRDTKPLGLYVDSESHVGALGTGEEPVGEQEG